jgi:hypothetical protein
MYVYAYDGPRGYCTYFKCSDNTSEHKMKYIASKKLGNNGNVSNIRLGQYSKVPFIQYHPVKGKIDPKKGDVWVSFTE